MNGMIQDPLKMKPTFPPQQPTTGYPPNLIGPHGNWSPGNHLPDKFPPTFYPSPLHPLQLPYFPPFNMMKNPMMTSFYHGDKMTSPCHDDDGKPDDPKVELENSDLWRKFHDIGTEMVITKTGRLAWQPVLIKKKFYLKKDY